MKLTHSGSEVTTSGTTDTRSFRIANSAHGFRILIDKLYSDKAQAPIRELWTNAHDSHVEAGCPERPFDTRLPNLLEPTFMVRDYGIGMDDETVYELYATIFSSTKQNTNTQVGAFGLGSKSPFAYTDGFQVRCFRDDGTHTFAAYIDDTGCPVITKMGHDPSLVVEGGVEVSFPVRSDDVHKFITAAKRCYVGYTVPPNVLNDAGEDFVTGAKFEFTATIGRARFFKSGDSAPFRGFVVRQGCVCYPVDTYELRRATGYPDRIDADMLIDFEIGELDVLPSREGLEMTAKTVKALDDAMVHVMDAVKQEVKTRVDAAPTYWAACRVYNEEILPNLSLGGDNVKFLNNVCYKGKALASRPYVTDLASPGLNATAATYARARDLSQTRRAFDATHYLPGRSPVYVIDTTDKFPVRAYSRIRQHYIDLYPGACVRHVPPAVLLRGDPKSMAFRRALVKMGRPSDIYMVSDIADDFTPAQRTYARSVVKVERATKYGTERETLDLGDGESVRYFVRKERNVLATNTFPSEVDVRASFLNARESGLVAEDAELYFVPKTYWKKVKKAGWLDFETKYEEVKTEIGTEAYTEARAHYHLFRGGHYRAAGTGYDALSLQNATRWVTPISDLSSVRTKYRRLTATAKLFHDFVTDLRGQADAQAKIEFVAAAGYFRGVYVTPDSLKRSRLVRLAEAFDKALASVLTEESLVSLTLSRTTGVEAFTYIEDFCRLLKK